MHRRSRARDRNAARHDQQITSRHGAGVAVRPFTIFVHTGSPRASTDRASADSRSFMIWKVQPMSALDQKADICSATAHVRFTPNSDRESGYAPIVMSALPLKADMRGARARVCFGPKADIAPIRSPHRNEHEA